MDESLDVDIEAIESEDKTEENEPQSHEEQTPLNESVQEKAKLVRFPLARVKHLMKLDPDCELISQDAILLVTKSAEMFLEYLAQETMKYTSNGKRKTIQKKDVDAAVDSVPNLYFLDGAITL